MPERRKAKGKNAFSSSPFLMRQDLDASKVVTTMLLRTVSNARCLLSGVQRGFHCLASPQTTPYSVQHCLGELNKPHPDKSVAG